MMAAYPDVDTATAAIEAHPLCATLTVTPSRYAVFYPAPYVVPGGVSVMRGANDLAALNTLYDRLQDFWSGQRLKVSK